MPAPPYRSGNWMPSSPRAPNFGRSSIGNRWASSQAMTFGAISRSANSRTAPLMTRSASLGRTSMASDSITRVGGPRGTGTPSRAPSEVAAERR